MSDTPQKQKYVLNLFFRGPVNISTTTTLDPKDFFDLFDQGYAFTIMGTDDRGRDVHIGVVPDQLLSWVYMLPAAIAVEKPNLQIQRS